MNVKSLLQLLLIVFVLASCEVPYEDNARLLIKGMIVDNNQAPISDVEVSAYLRRDNNFIYSSGSSGSGGEFLGNDLSYFTNIFKINELEKLAILFKDFFLVKKLSNTFFSR